MQGCGLNVLIPASPIDLDQLEKEFELIIAKRHLDKIPDQTWLDLYKQIERGE